MAGILSCSESGKSQKNGSEGVDDVGRVISLSHPELFGAEASGANSKRAVIDDCGRKVDIPADPRRIVALATADVEILFALGVGDRLIGIPDGVKYPPAALSIERIGGMYGRFSAEKIVGRSPDLVLMTISGWGQYRKHLDMLESHNITTLGLNYASNYDELIAQVRRIGFITGEYSAAALLSDSLERRRTAIVDKTLYLDDAERPRVYIEWISKEGGRGSTCGATGRNHEIITIAGGANIFAERTETSFTASDEEVISRNPQVIIITSDTTRMNVAKARAMLAARSGWRQTEALQKNRIFVIDHQLTWANPRMILGIELCARLIHPELFK